MKNRCCYKHENEKMHVVFDYLKYALIMYQHYHRNVKDTNL